ncbi:MAG: DUF6798 domain-containing protein, partial [Rubricoccaceae bacterium]|nr:DUF6798 domain-containing protein [Rubricoccaceae bacterium]
FQKRKTTNFRHIIELRRMLVVCAVLWGLGVVFVELYPVSLVAKLQLFKLTVPAAGIASILVCGGFVRILPEALYRTCAKILARNRLLSAASLILAVSVLFISVFTESALSDKLYPLVHSQSELGDIETWTRTNTPDDALFAIPPSNTTFRINGRRSVAANWQAVVFEDESMREWYERLMDFAPIDVEALPRGERPHALLDAAYASNDAERWRELTASYDLDYVLADTSALSLPFTVAYRNADWVVFDVQRAIGTE